MNIWNLEISGNRGAWDIVKYVSKEGISFHYKSKKWSINPADYIPCIDYKTYTNLIVNGISKGLFDRSGRKVKALSL